MVGFSTLSDGAIGGSGHFRPAFASAAIAKVGELKTIGALKADDSSRSAWRRAALYGALFFIAMLGALSLPRFSGMISPIWIAGAVLAWALLGAPTRQWPLYVAFAGAAHLLARLALGDASSAEALYLIADLASPVTLVALMRWRGDALAFEDRGETLRFLLLGGLLAPGVSAAIIALCAAGGVYVMEPRAVLTWFAAQALGFVVLLPLFNAVASNGWRSLFTPGTRRRTLLLFAILIGAFSVAWFASAGGFRIFMMLLIPYLVFVAFEAGLTAARAALAFSAVAIMAYAVFAPEQPDLAMNSSQFVLALQLYVGAMVACVLPIAAALAERERLHETASQALQDAQEAWRELLAAEAQFRYLAESPNDVTLRLNGEGDILAASPAAIALRQGAEGLVGANLIALAHTDDAARVRDSIAALAQGAANPSAAFWQLRLRDMNDAWVLYEVDATQNAQGEIAAVLRVASE